jgi:hypothetical protein
MAGLVERVPLTSSERLDLFWRLQFASVQPAEVIRFKYERQLRAMTGHSITTQLLESALRRFRTHAPQQTNRCTQAIQPRRNPLRKSRAKLPGRCHTSGYHLNHLQRVRLRATCLRQRVA